MIEQPSELVLVLSTLPDSAVAERIARQLVEERLIACANLLPGLSSIYRWDDAVRSEPEVLLLMKAPRSAVDALFQRIRELHPYELPELLAIPVEVGLRAYCDWVAAETAGRVA